MFSLRILLTVGLFLSFCSSVLAHGLTRFDFPKDGVFTPQHPPPYPSQRPQPTESLPSTSPWAIPSFDILPSYSQSYIAFGHLYTNVTAGKSIGFSNNSPSSLAIDSVNKIIAYNFTSNLFYSSPAGSFIYLPEEPAGYRCYKRTDGWNVTDQIKGYSLTRHLATFLTARGLAKSWTGAPDFDMGAPGPNFLVATFLTDWEGYPWNLGFGQTINFQPVAYPNNVDYVHGAIAYDTVIKGRPDPFYTTIPQECYSTVFDVSLVLGFVPGFPSFIQYPNAAYQLPPFRP